MRYCTFQLGRKTCAGIVLGDHVFNLAQACFRTFRRPFVFRDLGEFLAQGAQERIGEIDFPSLKSDRTVATPLRSVILRAPVLRPPKIVCVGLNYLGHARERKVEPPKEPLLFPKAPTAVIGPDETIEIPKGISEKVDPEVELAVVIGRPAFRLRREEAWSAVFGFTILNDVTARDVQRSDGQWFRGKSFRTFAPLGPHLVTVEEVKVGGAEIKLSVNGEVRQIASTSELIFDVPRLLEYASDCFPLEAGDVLSTGTPAGVGAERNPPVFLRPGDVVEAAVAGIGVLRNPVGLRSG